MGKNSWIIKVKDEVSHLEDITGTEMEDWDKHSIYKLPAYVTDLKVTDLNKSPYKPQAISFGPYHHGKLNLEPMEVHKKRALLHFLKKSGKPPEDYVGALGKILQQLKDAYDVLDEKWLKDSDAFLELMLRDGCFMIEVLRASSTDYQTGIDILRASSTDNQTGIVGYASNDPIFSSHGKLYVLPLIKRDMLMLENQLPMLLLKTLLAVDNQVGQTHEENINTLIHQFCSRSSSTKELGNELGKCLHVLDAYRKILLWTETPKQMPNLSKYSPGVDDDIFSARELREAGIRIRRNIQDTSLRGIHFDPKAGILSLPRIIVDDVSQTMFLNLIAFERFHVGAGNEVTDYICFMDDIIDNAMDVNILQKRDIIQNAIGSENAVAELFNSLTKDVSLDENSSLTEVRAAINHYCKTKWHRWKADLIQTYFRNPWALISVAAAIVLFGLTIAQTIYSGLQYQQGASDSPSPPPPPPPSRRS